MTVVGRMEGMFLQVTLYFVKKVCYVIYMYSDVSGSLKW